MLAGNVHPKAELGEICGLAAGLDERLTFVAKVGGFDGAKVYKIYSNSQNGELLKAQEAQLS